MLNFINNIIMKLTFTNNITGLQTITLNLNFILYLQFMVWLVLVKRLRKRECGRENTKQYALTHDI